MKLNIIMRLYSGSKPLNLWRRRGKGERKKEKEGREGRGRGRGGEGEGEKGGERSMDWTACRSPLQGHTFNELTSSHEAPSFKGSNSSQGATGW